MTEGRGTGIPKIKKMLAFNGSPPATFSTDDDRTHFLVTFPIHEQFEGDEIKGNVGSGGEIHGDTYTFDLTDRRILAFLSDSPKSRSEIASEMKVSLRGRAVNRMLERLQEWGLIEMTLPEKPSSRNQKYCTISTTNEQLTDSY